MERGCPSGPGCKVPAPLFRSPPSAPTGWPAPMDKIISTSLLLSLSPIAHQDAFQLAQMLDSTQVLMAHATKSDTIADVQRLIRWGMALGAAGGGMWAVRRAAGDLIGCAVRIRAFGEASPRLWIALDPRCWGAGYALDAAHALAETSRPQGWMGLAESPVTQRQDLLTRSTFEQLLRFPHSMPLLHQTPSSAALAATLRAERRGSER